MCYWIQTLSSAFAIVPSKQTITLHSTDQLITFNIYFYQFSIFNYKDEGEKRSATKLATLLNIQKNSFEEPH